MANTVKRTDIKNGSISSSKIASGSVTSDKLAHNSITSANLSQGCIETSHLSQSAISSFAGLVTGNAGPQGIAGINGTNGTNGTNGINGVSPVVKATVSFPVSLGIGNKIFLISASSNIGFSVGQRIKLFNSTDIWMEGEIYSISNNVIGFNSDIFKGTGTYSSWTTFIVGSMGKDGSNGSNGTNGTNGTNGINGINGAAGPNILNSFTTTDLSEGNVYSNGSSLSTIKSAYGQICDSVASGVTTKTLLNTGEWVLFGNSNSTRSEASILNNILNPSFSSLQNNSGNSRNFIVTFSSMSSLPVSQKLIFAFKLGSSDLVISGSETFCVVPINSNATNFTMTCIANIPDGDYINLYVKSASASNYTMISQGFRFSIVAL